MARRGDPPRPGRGRSPNLPGGPAVLGGMNETVRMDQHTLELLEFDKVRELVAGYAACSLGRELAQVRQKLGDLDERVQAQIRRLLRDPELRKILRYPNATVSGDHYVLPVAVNHRHRVQGVVHRTSSTGETVFIEPAGVASLSAERAVLKGNEEREIQRILRRLSGEVGKVSRPLGNAIDAMAQLDLITATA